MVRSSPSGLARVAAVLVLLLALVFLVELGKLTDASCYLAFTAECLIVLCVVAAQRLWFGGHLEGRLLGTLVATVALVGELLNVAVGLPGAHGLQGAPGPGTLAGLVLEVAIIATILKDGLAKPPDGAPLTSRL
ncbi:MAG: hypothetical protein ACXVXC_04255 [Nocardioidaceae bacterium]